MRNYFGSSIGIQILRTIHFTQKESSIYRYYFEKIKVIKCNQIGQTFNMKCRCYYIVYIDFWISTRLLVDLIFLIVYLFCYMDPFDFDLESCVCQSCFSSQIVTIQLEHIFIIIIQIFLCQAVFVDVFALFDHC